MKATVLVFAVVLGALALAAAVGPAHAQQGGPPPRAYESPMRDQCEEELAKDPRWMAELKRSIRPEVHEEEARLMLVNRKHVVMAYAALWILTALFLGFMWLRQQRLTGEIARLEKELARAIADEPPPEGDR
jgi:hypothetical protein